MEEENNNSQPPVNPEPQQPVVNPVNPNVSQQPQVNPEPQAQNVTQNPISQEPTVAKNMTETLNQTESPLGKPKKPWLAIIIALVLVAIVGIAAYFLLTANSSVPVPISDSGNKENIVSQEQKVTDPDIQELDQDLVNVGSDLSGIDKGLNDSPEDLTQ